MEDWEWIADWSSYRRDNGKRYVLIQQRGFGNWAVQLYTSLTTFAVKNEEVITDLEKAKTRGNAWLGF
jgi:hypothetical protein